MKILSAIHITTATEIMNSSNLDAGDKIDIIILALLITYSLIELEII